jgi:hypothetical protein
VTSSVIRFPPALRAGFTVLLGMFASGFEVARAQGSIAGTVRDSVGGPLADVEVIITSVQRRVRTDSAGKFTIAELPAGSYDLRFRKLGFLVFESKVRIRNGATTASNLVLFRRPVMLDTVRVTAECHRFQFEGFVCRRRNSTKGGVFFDADAIDSANPRFPKDIFREVPGFRVVAARGGLGLEALTGWRCVAEIVNGRLPTLQNPMPRWPKDMIGVEIYANVNDVPAEYRMFVDTMTYKRCSLVNYWTTPRPRR